MLQKLESGLLLLARIVIMVLVLLTLAGLVVWTMAALDKKPDGSREDVPRASSVHWSDVKVDDTELKRTTYSDFGYAYDAGMGENDRKLVADAAAAQAFAQVDALLRGAIERVPAARKAVEKAHDASGLAPAQTLEQAVKAQEQRNEASAQSDADAAVDAAAASTETQEAVSISQVLLERSHSVMEEHGYEAGHAFVLGAPAAFKTLLADPRVQKGIDGQPAATVVSNLMVNYGIAFASKASDAVGKTGDDSTWFKRLLEPSNLVILTILLWSFVLMMLIVVFLRLERYLRSMAAEGRVLLAHRTAAPDQA